MTTYRPGLTRLLPLLLAVSTAASAAACSSSTSEPSTKTTPAPTDPTTTPPEEEPVEPSATPPLRETIDPSIVSTLKKAGIDVAKPGALDDLTQSRGTLMAVMTSFTIALGTTCEGCHLKSGKNFDYEAETPKKNVAKQMWKNFVAGLAKADGTAIYCDSCHQGKMEFLDRADPRSLGLWMKDNFVSKLKRTDGKEHGCPTCHGDPFAPDVLDAWAK